MRTRRCRTAGAVVVLGGLFHAGPAAQEPIDHVGDLQQSAVVLAAIAWHAAVRDEAIPRRRR